MCSPIKPSLIISLLFTVYLSLPTHAQTEHVLLGSIETLGLIATHSKLDARIDTGADLSSLDARNIEEFSKDQKQWVRFQIVDRSNGQNQEVCAPVTNHVRIKRHGQESQCRPVISLDITIGAHKTSTEFTLVDRSNFKQPVLIGRNYLRGTAIVDVSQNHLAGQPTF